MSETAEMQERIENIIRGAMLPVACNGFRDIEIHAPQAAAAIVALLPTPPAPESATDPSACVEGGTHG